MKRELFKNLGSSFRRAEGGNIATLTAVALLVVVGATALSLDLSKGANTKGRLADASDALSLVLARSRERDPAEMQRIAANFLNDTYPGAAGEQIEIISLSWDGDAVTVKLSDVSKNAFGDFLGNGKDTDVSVESTAVFDRKIMDIAMVLDSTGSMGVTKMGNLKSAANEMVDIIDEYADTNVRMSVVPFNVYVNVGTSNRSVSWLNALPDQAHRAARSGRQGRPATATEPAVSSISALSEIPGRKFTGCVGSRLGNHHVRVGHNGRQFPALYEMTYSDISRNRSPRCPAQILPLTANFGNVKFKVNSLVSAGNTYIPAGLMWGWRTLDDSDPYAHSSAPDTEKVLILMTDGENTIAKNGVFHEPGNTSGTNSDTSRICELIKDEEITVYTIAYEVTDTNTRNMLQSCATANSQYYDARNAQDLRDAFEDIANTLIEVRIAA